MTSCNAENCKYNVFVCGGVCMADKITLRVDEDAEGKEIMLCKTFKYKKKEDK